MRIFTALSFMTKETVETDTPAFRAISLIETFFIVWALVHKDKKILNRFSHILLFLFLIFSQPNEPLMMKPMSNALLRCGLPFGALCLTLWGLALPRAVPASLRPFAGARPAFSAAARLAATEIHAIALSAGVPPALSTLPADTSSPLVSLLPVSATGECTLRINNDTLLRRYTNIILEWQLLVNGNTRQKGVFHTLLLSPRRPTLVRLPVRLIPGNEEVDVRVVLRRPAASPNPALPLFNGLLPLRPWREDNTIRPAGDLAFTDSNGVFTITAVNTLVQFDKQTGWLLHYEANHVLLMGDTAGLQPALWTPAIQPRLQLFSTSTGAQLVIVKAEYTLPEANCLLHLSYTINAAGEMLVSQGLEADSTRQGNPLPRFGMNWILPAGLDSVTWYGLAPGTPAPAIGTVTPAPAPPAPAIVTSPVTGSRESVYPSVRRLSLTGRDGKGLQITADSSLLQLYTFPAADSTARTLLGICKLSTSPLSYGNYQYAYKVNGMPAASTSTPANASHPPIRKQNR
jgi:hypothetical protein